MEYITEEEIEDRMALEGRMSSCPSNRDDLKEITIEELEQEHLGRIYEVWDEVKSALDDLDCVELLLKGWRDDEHISESVLFSDGIFFCGDWEIKKVDDTQWYFENVEDGACFLDVELKTGLELCLES